MYANKECVERRKDDRLPYSGKIFFATQKHLYEGDLVNFSETGLFIKSQVLLPVGKIITVAPPYSNVENDKRKGIITWTNEEGFGVKLLRTFEWRPVIVWQGSFS